MDPKEKYKLFTDTHSRLSVFHMPWWLDAVCGETNWDVVLSLDKENKIEAALPYFKEQKYGFLLIRQAVLTPYMGPILHYPRAQSKLAHRYAFEKKVIDKLVAQLPNYSYFNQHITPAFSNGQPFYWNGMNQSAYYTYQIDLNQSLKEIEDNYEGRVRTDIRKAEQKLVFLETEDVDRFYEMNRLSFDHQNIKMPYSIELVRRMDAALVKKDKRRIYLVKDAEGKVYAGAYIILDQQTVYTLMIGSDPALRKGGAVSFLISSIISKYRKDYDCLDFCGSMIEKFQRVFRSFGGVQQPYLRIHHKASTLFRLINALTGKGE